MLIGNTFQRVGLGTAALVLAGTAFGGAAHAADFASTSAAAKQATCEGWRLITMPGGEVKYNECHRTYKGKRQSSVTLYVADHAYNSSPRARVVIGAWEATYSHYNPGGPDTQWSEKYKTGWHNGGDAKVTLSIVRHP
ncbi:hypothetical protein LE181_07950 [Streptomyces sp. SCA3-4]|uniref:hypothetical protein n=1 Tax=Streptomyces sichuanensis TaxID=2871810 RepID=UPI001CE31439|nr:hypothetical protein [Streptomyces sichuanensis]MCA6092091.1 hypothetical protein [Streptomyces sichuanensis]